MNLPGGSSSRGSHRLSEAAICPRKWYIHNVLKKVPVREPEYFVVGRLVHVALAYWFAQRLEVKPEWFQTVTLLDALNIVGAGYPEAIKLALDILPAYTSHYGADAQWNIISIEEEYTATIGEIRALTGAASRPGDGERVSCRIDLLVACNGKLWGVDYKTIGRSGRNGKLESYNPGAEYAIPWQFLLQTGVLRHNFGAKFGGIVVEQICKKAPYDFHREVIEIPLQPFLALPDTASRMCQTEHRIIDLMQEVEAQGTDLSMWLPDGNFWSCFPYGKPCEYRPLCLASSNLKRQEVLASAYQDK